MNVYELSRYVAEALVAFANADGGAILIGVEDDGTISGLPNNPEKYEAIAEQYRDLIIDHEYLPIELSTRLILEEDVSILYFQVSKATNKIFQLSDGRCVIRKDKQTVPVSFDQISFERQEIISREYDRVFVDGATVDDLDLSLIKSMSNEYLPGLSAEYYLQQIGLAEFEAVELRFKRAALLLFAKNINKWHPRCQIRIIEVNGIVLKSGREYNVKNDETISGNIFELLSAGWNRIKPYLAYKTEFGENAVFEQKFSYPEEAIREAIVNAITHRDYSLNNGIEFYIYSNRIELVSPGRLLSTISIESLRNQEGNHESRNSNIANTLREHKIVRELGEGMRRIYEVLMQNEMDLPILEETRNSFKITFNNSSIYTDKELTYLKLFDSFDLSNNQKKIVLLGMKNKEISPNDIYSAMNTNDRNTYDREVTVLRNNKILKSVRTNQEATNLARKNRIAKNKIGRFKIAIPKN
ncbi:MAG: ATP-binding protein [Phaeodactylibacter xiamenensis]|uniref:ATP-binding protein n=1 Tax=Phaeodactylibacter xiamenensis TaxID=1524460 RepID=UPI0021CEE62E|nr:ATP-binding protein [Phaeodactylibacter xiamenensis]MCR9166610.1 putative DNA binding domain-containing protein [bacterium]